MERRERTIEWTASGDAERPWEARVDGERWQIRLNDGMAPRLYTLVIAGTAAEEFAEWPKTWTRPPAPGVDMAELREMELERAKFERTKDVAPSKLVE
jgi:hypothetical protein